MGNENLRGPEMGSCITGGKRKYFGVKRRKKYMEKNVKLIASVVFSTPLEMKRFQRMGSI